MNIIPYEIEYCRYHSESGWQTLLEVIFEHYGLEVDQSAITIFICLVPVVIDACVKLWVCYFDSNKCFIEWIPIKTLIPKNIHCLSAVKLELITFQTSLISS